MSFNITSWKTKKIKDFIFAEEYLDDLQDAGFTISKEPAVLLGGNVMVTAEMCNCGVVGLLVLGSHFPEFKDVRVMSIGLQGEFSGHLYHEEFNEIFQNSSGELEAAIIWEGGEQIQRLHVLDGIITEENIEL